MNDSDKSVENSQHAIKSNFLEYSYVPSFFSSIERFKNDIDI